MSRLRVLCFCQLTAVCFAVSLPAQDAEPGPESIFQDTIGVEIVNIDVVVTDKKGHAVEGLTRDDFELRVDGEKVPIANFYAVVANTATPNAGRVRATGGTGRRCGRLRSTHAPRWRLRGQPGSDPRYPPARAARSPRLL